MDSKREKYGRGVTVAVITPLKKDRSIDRKGLETIINHDISGGVHGIFVLGTTGEGPCFTEKDRVEIIRTARKVTPESIPLYVGVMDTSTRRVKENIILAQDNGADIVVVTPPYFLSVRPGKQDEIIRHMELSAKYANVPVIAYNIPQCTYVNIELPTVRRILEIDNVIGLKDSSGDWEQFQKEIFLKNEINFKLQMGAEDLAGAALLMGADGCVSGVGNYEPGLIVQMYEEAKQGKIEKVKQLQRKAARLRETCFVGEFWLSGLKYACSALGLCEEYVSEPFPRLTEAQKQEVRNILKREDRCI